MTTPPSVPERPSLRALYPSLSESELREARSRLVRYLSIASRVHEEQGTETMDLTDAGNESTIQVEAVPNPTAPEA